MDIRKRFEQIKSKTISTFSGFSKKDNSTAVKRIFHAESGLQLDVHQNGSSSPFLVEVNSRFEPFLDLHHVDERYWVDIDEITSAQIQNIVNYTYDGFIDRTTGHSINGKQETPLTQELLYLLSKKQVKVSGTYPHDSSRKHPPGSMPTKRLEDGSELTLTTILLLKIFVWSPESIFTVMLGFAPADDIFKIAKLDPTLVYTLAELDPILGYAPTIKVRIDVNMLEPILEALVEQITYGSNFSVGYERLLTEAAATLVRIVLLREELKKDMIKEKLGNVTKDYGFTERQYGVFVGVVYAGVLMLLQGQAKIRADRIALARDITSVALSVLGAVPLFGNIVGPIANATAIFFSRLGESNEYDAVMNAIDEFFLDLIRYPNLKLQWTTTGEVVLSAAEAQAMEAYKGHFVQKEAGSLTVCEWMRISLESCGFGRPRYAPGATLSSEASKR